MILDGVRTHDSMVCDLCGRAEEMRFISPPSKWTQIEWPIIDLAQHPRGRVRKDVCPPCSQARIESLFTAPASATNGGAS